MSLTPLQRQWLLRAQRRILDLEPDMRSAYLAALRRIIDSMSEAELVRAIASGDLQRVVETIFSDPALDRALYPIRQQMRRNIMRSFQYATTDLPKGGKINGTIAVQFDWLNPAVVQAIKTMESRALDTIKADARATVRQAVQAGLESGAAPRTVARGLRSVIGLAPSREQWVRNLRAELEAGRYSEAMKRALLDKRFKLANLDTLSAAERAKRIDLIVETYRKRMLAHSVNVQTKTLTFDAYRQGQRLSWLQAQENGLIPPNYVLMKKWVHLMPQPDPRETHIAMGALPAVPADQNYQNGDSYAGESDPWNCHCLDRYYIARAA